MRQHHDQEHPDLSLDIDWEHLHQVSDHNPSFAIELLSLFGEDAASKMNALRVAAEADHYAKLQDLVHYIKGAAANVGVASIVAIAQQLEVQDLASNRATVALLLDSLEANLQALERFVQHERSS